MHRLSDTQAEGPANSLRLVRNLSEGDSLPLSPSLSLSLSLSLFLSLSLPPPRPLPLSLRISLIEGNN